MSRRSDDTPTNVVPLPVKNRQPKLRRQAYSRVAKDRAAVLLIPVPATAELQLLVIDRLLQNFMLQRVDIFQHGAMTPAQYRSFVTDLGPVLAAAAPVSELMQGCPVCGEAGRSPSPLVTPAPGAA